MNTVRVLARAKLNFTLDITGKEKGYHMLDSLVTTVSLADRIVVKRRKDRLVNVLMHGMGSESLPPEYNNAQRAGEAFVAAFQTTGADISVFKNIPMGAGLGGSSADAAGVLNALAKLYGVTDHAAVKRLADGLGSDTGYLLTGGFARLRGRGEQIERMGELPPLHFLLFVPKGGVSTAECYRIYDESGETYAARTPRALEYFGSGNIEWAAKLFGNALFDAAKRLDPDVAAVLEEAKSFSPWGAGMTGSGSAVYALFPTRELCEWAKSRYRGKARVCYVTNAGADKQVKNPFVLDEEELR